MGNRPDLNSFIDGCWHCLYYTNSRGSIFATGCNLTYFVFSYWIAKEVIFGVILAALLFVAGTSRMGGISELQKNPQMEE